MDQPDRIRFLIGFSVLVALSMPLLHFNHVPTAWEWFLTLTATFGASRIVAREKVGQPIRDAAEGTHLQELVNCPRCVGVWLAYVFTMLVVMMPKASMLPLILFSVGGVNILWQEVLGILCRLTTICDNRIAIRTKDDIHS